MQPEYVVSVIAMVKRNINAVLRDKVMTDDAFNEFGEMAITLLSNNPKAKGKLEDLIDLEEFKKGRNQDRWGAKEFGKSIGFSDRKAMERLLAPIQVQGSHKQIDIKVLLMIAYKLDVTIGFLLQPTKRQLEEDALLIFEDFGDTELRVSATQWLAWVNNWGFLPGTNPYVTMQNSLILSNANLESKGDPMDIRPKADATNRMNESDGNRIERGYISPASVALDALRTSPFRSAEEFLLGEPSADKEPESPISEAQVLQRLAHNIRESLARIYDPSRAELRESDLQVSISKISKDLDTLSQIHDYEKGPHLDYKPASSIGDGIEKFAVVLGAMERRKGTPNSTEAKALRKKEAIKKASKKKNGLV